MSQGCEKWQMPFFEVYLLFLYWCLKVRFKLTNWWMLNWWQRPCSYRNMKNKVNLYIIICVF